MSCELSRSISRKMFKGLVLKLIRKYLDHYILNLDDDVIQLGLGGSVVLTNLQLRPEALFELNLPVEVKAGYIGKISIELSSWMTLFSEPVKFSIEDVLVLAGPVTDRAYDEVLDEKLMMTMKQRTLEAIERITAPSEGLLSTNAAFWQKLATTVVNNVQITVQRVHIRFEDTITCADYANACGIMLQEATIETTDEQWRPEWIASGVPIVHKLLRLQKLSMYWDTYLCEKNLVRNKLHTSDWQTLLQNSIVSHQIMDEIFEFFVHPISVDVHLKLNREEVDPQTPLLELDVSMKKLQVIVSRQQYLSFLDLCESIRIMTIGERYRKYSAGMQLKGNARNRWAFARKAIVEEYIRPYEWIKISQHRQKYRRYKQLYKLYLKSTGDLAVAQEITDLEKQLDVANIVMARENAKLELAEEMPDRISAEKATTGWFSWLWYASSCDEDSDEEHTVSNSSSADFPASNLPGWFRSLEPEQREILCKSIGYNDGASCWQSRQCVAQQFHLHLTSFTMSLKNNNEEILKVSLNELDTCYQTQPKSDSFRFSVKTESLRVDGLSAERNFVQVMTSDIEAIADQSTVKEVFNVQLEQRPPQIEADYSLEVHVQPIEIAYDEYTVGEMMAFFRPSRANIDALKAAARSKLDKIARISRAGLQYAIEQHKTLNLMVHVCSPYVVIPEYGSLHRGGSVMIVDFGRLKIESVLQQKNKSYTMSEVESQLYDKYMATLSDIKILLADTEPKPVLKSRVYIRRAAGHQWRTAVMQPELSSQIVPNFSVELSLYNSVTSDYTHFPRHKLESRMTALKVCISDHKLRKLVNFRRLLSVQHGTSTTSLNDCVDGTFELAADILDESKLQHEPSLPHLLELKRSLSCTAQQSSDVNVRGLTNRASVLSSLSSGSEHYFTASDHSDDDINSKTTYVDGATSPLATSDNSVFDPNPVSLRAGLHFEGLCIELSQRENDADVSYLVLRVGQARVNVEKAEYTVSIAAQIASVQLIDELNTDPSGEHLKILDFDSNTDMMTVTYKMLLPDCPSIDITNQFIACREVAVELAGLLILFDREAMLSLYRFVKKLQSLPAADEMQSSFNVTQRIVSFGSKTADQCMQYGQVNGSVSPLKVKFHVITQLAALRVQLSDHGSIVTDIAAKGLKGQISVREDDKLFQVELSDLGIDDCSANTRYTQVVWLDDEKSAFDLKYVQYLPRRGQCPAVDTTDDWKLERPCDGCLTLRVGCLNVVAIYKFISDLQVFLQPFVNPELFQSYTTAAQMAIYNKVSSMHDQGSWIKLLVDIHAPVIHIPQHSQAADIIQISLGNLTISNSLVRTSCNCAGAYQIWDQLSLILRDLSVIRCKLTQGGHIEPTRTLLDRVGLSVELMRALSPHLTELHCDIKGALQNVTLTLTQLDMMTLLSVLHDNLTEVQQNRDAVDFYPSGEPFDHSYDSHGVVGEMKPSAAIQRQVYSLASDVIDGSLKQTKFAINIDGLSIILRRESISGSAESSSVEDLTTFSIGLMNVFGELSSSTVVDLTVTLESMTLEDTRSDSELAVKNMIQSCLNDDSNSAVMPPVIVFRYWKSKDGNQQTLELDLDRVRVNFCAVFILTLSDFLSVPYKKMMELFVGDQTRQTNSGIAQCRVDSTNSCCMSKETDEINYGAWKILARVKHCEVVLFAEPWKGNSKVLLVKTNACYERIDQPGSTNSELKLQQLQVISYIYGSYAATSTVELHPCDVEVTCQRLDESGGRAVNVRLSDICMQISAATIHIAIDVVNMLRLSISRYQLTQECKDVSESNIPHTSVATDLWSVQTISSEKWLNTKPDLESVTNSAIHVRRNDPPVESLTFDAGRIVVIYELRSVKHVPVLSLATAIRAEVYDYWSNQMRATVDIQVELNSYNDKLCVWEPVIEPVSDDGERHYRPWGATLKLLLAPSHPINCTSIELNVEHEDQVDGGKRESSTRTESDCDPDSSETEVDSDTEMTVIRPKEFRARIRGNDDDAREPSDVQSKSDSEAGTLNAWRNDLQSLSSSDSDDDDDDDVDSAEKGYDDDDVMDEKDQHYGYDYVDSAVQPENVTSLCNYVVFHTSDQLKINVTACNIRVFKDVCQALTEQDCGEVKSSGDFSFLEIFNEVLDSFCIVELCGLKVANLALGIPVTMTLHSSQKVTERDLHNVSIEFCPDDSRSARQPMDAGVQLVEAEGPVNEFDELKRENTCLDVAPATSRIFDAIRISYVIEDDVETNKEPEREQVNIKLEGFEPLTGLSFRQKSSRLLRLSTSKNETDYCMIFDVNVADGRKTVTLRSPLLFCNDLTVAINIFCVADELRRMCSDEVQSIYSGEGHQYVKIATVEAHQQYCIPLYIAYNCQLYLSPANIPYEVASTAIWWPDFCSVEEYVVALKCQPQAPNIDCFCFKAKFEKDISCLKLPSMPKRIPNVTIRISPPIVVHNLLPYNLGCCLEGSSSPVTLSCGMQLPLYNIQSPEIQPKLKFWMYGYMGVDMMSSAVEITRDLKEEFKTFEIEFERPPDADLTDKRRLRLSVRVGQRVPVDVFVYSPYWLLNKTGLPIQIRALRSDTVYKFDDRFDGPVLFQCDNHRTVQVRLRIHNSMWTQSFSLDSVGISGLIQCNDKERSCKYKCSPFWPVTDSMMMYVKYFQSDVCSQRFPFNVPHRTVLRMDRGTALLVEASLMDGSMLVRIVPYCVGDCPVRVDNLCEGVCLKLQQKSQNRIKLLSPNESLLYTWDDPTSERTLMWNVYGCRHGDGFPAVICKDDAGLVTVGLQRDSRRQLAAGQVDGSSRIVDVNNTANDSANGDDNAVDATATAAVAHLPVTGCSDAVVIYWVSYLDGPQRVLLLTLDEHVAIAAKQIGSTELCHTSLFVSFPELGVSLVNDQLEELAYATVTGSTTLWEVKRRKTGKWKKLPPEQSAWLEERWQSGADVAVLPGHIEATLDKKGPFMTKPKFRMLRRNGGCPAVWIQLMRSEHNTYMHFRIHRIQIDNQLTDACMPVVFYPSPLPSHVLERCGGVLKPFVELVVLMRSIPEHTLVTYKCVNLLVQAFTVNLDRGFVASLYDMYSCTSQGETDENVLLNDDVMWSNRTLGDYIALHDIKSQRCIFEYIHLSPLQVKLSVSFNGKAHLSTANNHMMALFSSDIVGFLLNSFGAKLADIDGADIKFTYFERQGSLTSYSQLLHEVSDSYRIQALKHAYVVIFGLTVLGKPYSLFSDVTQGLEDFYEPFFSSVQQPDKFAAQLLNGIHSLLGHTIGGMAGSASAITRTLGKAVSFLSFDSDYKGQRRQLILHQPHSMPESLRLAARSFAMGVSLGLSGIVTKPLKGAQEKGIEGFFKGLGKALLNMLTKPIGGTVDMVSIVFDGIHRLAEMGEDVVVPFRQPRFIHPMQGLKPYSTIQAQGASVLRSVQDGSSSSTDVYFAHALLGGGERPDILMITERQVMLLKKTHGWSPWSVQWKVLLSSLLSEPRVDDHKLVLRVIKDEQRAGAADCLDFTEQRVECDDEAVLVWLCDRLNESVERSNSNSMSVFV